MEKLGKVLLKFKYSIASLFIILMALSTVFINKVDVNYDLTSYLPKDIESMQGLEIFNEEFDNEKSISLIVKDTTIVELDKVLEEFIKEEKVIAKDIEELKTGIENKDDHYKVNVVLDDMVSAKDIIELVDVIDNILENHSLDGGLISNTADVPFTPNMTISIAITLAFIILIMILTTKSYFEIVVIVLFLGITVLLNMGSNFVLGSISNVTLSAATLIQLAVSIDYSLFMINNYRKEKEINNDEDIAIIKAMKKSLKPIAAGALTTIAGFLALTLMKLELGGDLGVVLAKGILISLISTITILPILIKLFSKLIEKTKHRSYLPSFRPLGKLLTKKLSVVIVFLFVAITAFSYVAQSNNDYLYGDMEAVGLSSFDKENFEQAKNTMVLLIEKEDATIEKISSFREKVLKNDIIKDKEESIVSYTLIHATVKGSIMQCASVGYVPAECAPYQNLPADPSLISDELVDQVILSMPQGIKKDELVSDTYERIVIFIDGAVESEETFEFIKNTRELAEEEFSNKTYLLGKSASYYDMKIVNNDDYKVVSLISILAVFIIILISFKSLSIPVILVAIIQAAIWINMSFAYIEGSKLLFMGFIIVSSIQLGATIDYAILLTEYYKEKRFDENEDKKEALTYSINRSGHSLLTSSLSLVVGGIVMSIFDQGATAELGILLSRGAFISLLISLLVLPQVLFLLDPIIRKEDNLKKSFMKK